LPHTRVKICCISSIAEAQLAIDHGANALGLVAAMPTGPGILDDASIREIARMVPPGVETFLLTARDTADDIADHVDYCGTTTVQIVRHIEPAQYPRLVERLPRVRRVQVIHVEDREALDLIPQYENYVHAFLLDSGRPKSGDAALGGTGRRHDWSISREFVQRSNKPVFLAGGLAPSNAAAAVADVAPFGLDLCSGVRTNNQLDADKLGAFMAQVWG